MCRIRARLPRKIVEVWKWKNFKFKPSKMEEKFKFGPLKIHNLKNLKTI